MIKTKEKSVNHETKLDKSTKVSTTILLLNKNLDYYNKTEIMSQHNNT